jgi:TatA/E family protein of Tat protein translocase
MGPLGVPETILIFVLALLLFGPKKLPELGKTIGKAMSEFRRASSELKETFDREMQTIERETDTVKQETKKYTDEIYSYNYDHDHDTHYDSGVSGTEPKLETASVPSHTGASATQGADASKTAETAAPQVAATEPATSVPSSNGMSAPVTSEEGKAEQEVRS